MDDTIYVYSFVAWPDEKWGFGKAFFELFNILKIRVERDFTEQEFAYFREELEAHGITLREVERVPYCDPEPVL